MHIMFQNKYWRTLRASFKENTSDYIYISQSELQGGHLRNHWYCQCVKHDRVGGIQCAYKYREASQSEVVEGVRERARKERGFNPRNTSIHFNRYLFIYLFILTFALGWAYRFWSLSGWQHSAHSFLRRGSGLLQWWGRNPSAAPRAPRSGWPSVPRWMPAVRRFLKSRAAVAASPALWRAVTRAASTLHLAALGCAVCRNLESPDPYTRSPADRRCARRPPSQIRTKANKHKVSYSSPSVTRSHFSWPSVQLQVLSRLRWFNVWWDFIINWLGYLICLRCA